jgi:hypothetical protein
MSSKNRTLTPWGFLPIKDSSERKVGEKAEDEKVRGREVESRSPG